MTSDDAIGIVDEALAKVDALRSSRANSPDHVEFIQTTGMELARVFGPDSVVARNFSRIDYQSVGSFVGSAFDFDADIARRRYGAFLRGLDVAEGVLRSARNQLASRGVEDLLRQSRIRSGGARIFVSHGTESPALAKVERFLRALGVEPIVVSRGPSEGMAVDDLVEKRMAEADCAIILATADEEVEGRRQPRPNLIHEIGLAQEKLGMRVIYLKEEGCEFPSNVRPKVWENFTQQNMECGFEKISKELRAFGLL